MEVFSLLKYWRGGGGRAAAPATATARRSTIATSILRSSAETDADDGEGDDDGPFFDLEFSVPDEDGEAEEEGVGKENGDTSASESDEEGQEGDFDCAVSSEGSCSRGGLRSDPSFSLSPPDELFFKGSSLVFTNSEPNSKPQFPASLLKSATKFRVFMFRFRKPKSSRAEPVGGVSASPKPQHSSKLFIKFKVEEAPIVSLFTRDNSSKSSGHSGRSSKLHAEVVAPSEAPAAAGSEEKKIAKDVVQRYLSKIKPFYTRASKRYGEKLGFSGRLGPRASRSRVGPAAGGRDKPQAGNVPAGLRVVCRRLRKSRSASSAVVAVRSPPPPPRRRDDSLLQQEDGIQSAIAHCKRSLNADKGSELLLARSRSDPGGGESRA